MGGNPVPQPTAVVDNKSAAEALKAELGFASASAATTNTAPISAKAALKRKVEVMEENGDTETDYSTPATPIPKLKSNNGVVEDVADTVRYKSHRERN